MNGRAGQEVALLLSKRVVDWEVEYRELSAKAKFLSGNEEVLGVTGKYGVPGKNVSGEKLLEMCSELELLIGNTYFRKKFSSFVPSMSQWRKI